MAPITKCIALFSLVLSATALTSPHISNNVFNHRRAVAHVAVQAVTSPVDAPPTPKRNRSLNKRCVPKPSGNSTVSSSSTSTSAAATNVPVNVAPSPVTTSTSSHVASPFSSPSSSHSSSTSESVHQAPTPTPTPTPTSTSQTAPAQTSSTSSSGSSNGYLSGTQSGQGTFYATGLGACGITNTDSDYIAAVSHLLFDAYPGYDGVNPNTNPVCNKKVTAHYGGKSVTVAITDRCTGCALQDLDFSPSAFTQLADESLGRIDITWAWA